MTSTISSARTSRLDHTSHPSLPVGFLLTLSTLIWLVLTAILRLWGASFFLPESPLSMGLFFLGSPLVLPLVIYGIFRGRQIGPSQQPSAAVCLAVPAMLLDAAAMYGFPQFFPNLPAAILPALSAWFLWSYAIIVLTGVALSRWQSGPSA